MAKLRKLLDTRKVGHGGTLDPAATGVLPVAIGKATRLIQYLPSRKVYRAVIRFGLTTTTDDLEGEVLTQQSATHLQQADVEALLPQFTGTLTQRPPAYSAIQVQGQRLYNLARQGKPVEAPARQVTIYKLVSRGWRTGQQPELILDVACGPGTYIRALARDLGAALGTGATLAQLLRTHSNGFNLASSTTFAALEADLAAGSFAPTPAGEAVCHLTAIALSPALGDHWTMGQRLALIAERTSTQAVGIATPGYEQLLALPAESPLRVMDAATGDFLGIGEIRSAEAIADLEQKSSSRYIYIPSCDTPDRNNNAKFNLVLIPKLVLTET